MPRVIQIEVGFDPRSQNRPFQLPEATSVPLDSIVEWVISDETTFDDILILASEVWRQELIKFTLYFEISSSFEEGYPFKWKTQSLIIDSNSFPSIGRFEPILIASGEPEAKGDFKYGLKLESQNSDNSHEYDEDPWLMVY